MSNVSTPSSSRRARRRRSTASTPTSTSAPPPPPRHLWLEKIDWDRTYVGMTYHCWCENKVEMVWYKTGLRKIINVVPNSVEIEQKIPDVQVDWTDTRVCIRCTCECGAGCLTTFHPSEDRLSFEARLPQL